MIVDRTRLRRSLGVREDGSKETSMTKQADFKARVRARMARTGESYATAAPTCSRAARCRRCT